MYQSMDSLGSCTLSRTHQPDPQGQKGRGLGRFPKSPCPRVPKSPRPRVSVSPRPRVPALLDPFRNIFTGRVDLLETCYLPALFHKLNDCISEFLRPKLKRLVRNQFLIWLS